jgi:chromosome segregation ATPase
MDQLEILNAAVEDYSETVSELRNAKDANAELCLEINAKNKDLKLLKQSKEQLQKRCKAIEEGQNRALHDSLQKQSRIDELESETEKLRSLIETTEKRREEEEANVSHWKVLRAFRFCFKQL